MTTPLSRAVAAVQKAKNPDDLYAAYEGLYDVAVDVVQNPVAVLCVRHPDYSNEHTVSSPGGLDVVVITADYGSNFDGQPRNTEEGEYAVEMADSLTEEVVELRDGDPVKEAVRGIADELLGYAEELDVDIEAVREDNRQTALRVAAMEAQR